MPDPRPHRDPDHLLAVWCIVASGIGFGYSVAGHGPEAATFIAAALVISAIAFRR